jgi:MFS transporter, DHA1 family, multidrug resistance protein
LVKEKFVPFPTERNPLTFKKKLAFISNHKTLLVMFSLLFLFQLSIKAITPILSLFIENLVSNPNIVSSVTGLMFALTGITAAISAVVMGNFFEKNPSIYILIIGFIGAGVFFFPQGIVTSIKQLAVLRFCLGLFYGAIIPIANTIISLSTPARNRGKVFGISNSITFLGQILGPIIGGLVMTFFDIPSVFFVTGSILLLTGLVLPIVIRNTEMPFFKRNIDSREDSIKGVLVFKHNK